LSDQSSQRREENSVLIALKELRGMEDARVKREQDDARARIEAERAAKEAAARRAREEEEARVRAEEERVRRIEEEKQNRLREEQLRVEEAERRARVEGEMKLQEERMRLEIQSRAQHRSPLKAVVGAVAVVAIVGGIIIYRVNAQNKAEAAAAAAAAAHDRQVADERARAREAEFNAKLNAITKEMEDKLSKAKTEAERDRIRRDAEAKQVDAERSAGKTHSRKGDSSSPSTPKAPKYKDPGKRDINDDILNGL